LNDEPYSRVDGEWIGNLSGTWTSAADKYSVTGYMRNVTDNDYKGSATLSGLGTSFSAQVSNGSGVYDPRTFGVILQAKF
jgi:iron complex outermembrane receptor protein